MHGEVLVSASNEEEALAEALNRLGVDREAVEYEVNAEDEESLLPGAKPEVELRAWIRPEYVADMAEERLRKILELMEFEFTLSISVERRIVRLDVSAGDSSSLLIGRDGQNLDALQYLLNRMVLKSGREAPMVLVDIEGYRMRQYGEMESLVRRAVERARETGNEIELDPMPAFDRKYLHHYLTRFDGIKTFSRGEEPERYMVIIAD